MKVNLLLILIGLLSFPAQGQRLDDSLSPRQRLDLELNWKHSMVDDDLDNKQFNALEARMSRVETRLNTASFVGEKARIFLELPADIRGLNAPEALLLSWTTNGLFQDGSVSPGNQRLIFEGDITEDVMIDIFDFTIEIDGRYYFQTIQFEPIYDIQVIH